MFLLQNKLNAFMLVNKLVIVTFIIWMHYLAIY